MKNTVAQEDNTFIQIPSKVLKINHFVVNGKRIPFKPELKLYYGYLYTWTIQVDKVCPSKELIAEQMGESKPTVIKRIDQLVNLGLLRIELEGRKHVYYLTMPDEVTLMQQGVIGEKVESKQFSETVKSTIKTQPNSKTSDIKHTACSEQRHVEYFSPELHDDEQSTNVEIIKPAWISPKVHPWGDVPIFTSNGQFSYEAKSWAESGNTSEEAIDKMKEYRKGIGDPNWNNYITFQYSDSDEEGLPF